MHLWLKSYLCFCRVWMKLVEVAKRFYQDHTRKMDFTAWLWGWMEFYYYSPGLCTSVHYKPTDSHSYLLYSSSHPSHVKNYIPYSQFLWPRHLCSEDSDFSLKQSGEMCDFFDKRGYSAAICCSSRPSLRPSYSHRRNTTVSLETYPLYSIP